jgi:hypothetical protein
MTLVIVGKMLGVAGDFELLLDIVHFSTRTDSALCSIRWVHAAETYESCLIAVSNQKKGEWGRFDNTRNSKDEGTPGN